MRVTILETGRAPGRLAEDYPSYPEMFVSLLSKVDESLTFESVAVIDGSPPPDPARCEAIVITGSPAGVYDAAPWMDPMRRFVREAFAVQTPMVGVCFGHQIIADAMGGVVRKSEKGWGVGRHVYEIIERRPWMTCAGPRFSLSVSHQDQVIVAPPGATTLARSTHTEHAMLAYASAPVISLQGHPEFSDAFVSALYRARRSKTLSDSVVDAALESLRDPEDNALVGEWMVNFLRRVQ
jgi:GMP synthase-like glutamine amidotransferase